MKKIILYFYLILLNNVTFSQVGIGTAVVHDSAVLELKSSNKGFLINKVELTSLSDVTTITSPATGLLVYNTATNGIEPNNVVPGFYYYDGARWVSIEFANGTNVNIKNSNYILNQNDSKGVIIMDSATPVTVTIPTTLSKGFFCQIIQKGAGQVTVLGGSGFTIKSAHGFKSRTLNSSIGIVLENTTTGYISGDSTF